MDPLAIQAGTLQTVRPVLGLDASLTSILREGRMVAGEVLQTFAGHSVMIGIGRHRVPAESGVELQTGQRFLARVVEGKDGIVLKIVGGPQSQDSRLLVALRSAVGQDRPIGQLLGDVASRLRAAVDAGGANEKGLTELLKQVGEHVFLPGASGAELRDLIARSGLDYEALLLAESQGGRGVVQLQRALGALMRQLLGGLGTHLAQQGLALSPQQLDELKQRLLRAVADPGPLVAKADGAEALSNLRGELERRSSGALEGAFDGPAREALRGALPGALDALLADDGELELLQRLLKGLAGPAEPADLARNLKARLLGALAELPEGPSRAAVAKAVAGLEAEQLLNLARREFQEGWHLSLPVPDGERWATAHLFYSDPDGGERQLTAGEDMQRLTVAVDFSRLGPLRAELGLRDDLVALRLIVAREDVAAELRRELPALVERLDIGGREARISVVLGTRQEAEVERLGTNIRWLEEHHLMDLQG